MSIPVILLMGLTLGGALLGVTSRNILHAVFGLAIALFAIAGVFGYLHSPFVATMQVIIYVGGISVAMVFAVMMSRSIGTHRMEEGLGRRLRGLVVGGLFFATMALAITGATLPSQPPVDAEAWSVARIGTLFLTDYNLVFEMLSVVLLLAVMGAVAVAQRDKRGQEAKR